MQLQALSGSRLGTAPRCSRGLASRSRSNGVRVLAVADGIKVKTPHSGYHFSGGRGPFFESWKFKVDTPEGTFSLLYSIEHPSSDNDLRGMAVQVMGPNDEYLCQYTKDTSSFWASRNDLELGGCFKAGDAQQRGSVPQKMLSEARFNDAIAEGFQASDTWNQGAIVSDDANCDGMIPNFVETAEWAFDVRPLYGWGDSGTTQKATAGWLSSLPVFNPQGQVLMAHGMADGYFKWGDQLIEFNAAPTYSEKMWGTASFPNKWFWIQCNSFEGHPNLSITGQGAKRGLGDPNGGQYEDMGLIGIHYQGNFLELVPWKGKVEWEVDPWGRWKLWAKDANHEALIECSTTQFGTLLRAPTAETGLAPFCRDSFSVDCRVRVWKVDGHGLRKSETPIIDAESTRCACEVGGGPWWTTWKGTAKLTGPVSSALNVPIDIDGVAEGLAGVVGKGVLPPGL